MSRGAPRRPAPVVLFAARALRGWRQSAHQSRPRQPAFAWVSFDAPGGLEGLMSPWRKSFAEAALHNRVN